MKNKLFIVATPIGNIKDITLRALEALKEVDIIACEDTRVSSKLLNHYQIKKPLISYHNFNEKENAKKIIDFILLGKSVALISDAGTPLISDPGFNLINEAIKHDIEIETLPGPSAFVNAFVLSGFNYPFTFLGFLKDKSSQRIKELENLDYGTYIIYVAPHKLLSTLEDLDSIFGSKINIFLVKELTKIYEKHYRGTVVQIQEQLQNSSLKGEFTLVFQYSEDKKTKVKINKYQQFSKAKEKIMD